MYTTRKSKNFFYTFAPTHCTGAINLAVKVFLILLVTVYTFGFSRVQAQENTKKQKADTAMLIHSARRAAIMSAALPGLGQVYNKKYWKIPIIYAGFGVLTYFIIKNTKEYHNFRTAYNIVATGDSANFDNECVVRYNANLSQLEEGRNYYRRNMNLSYILAGALYILNIIDASVDASLYDFDVTDDLSIRFEPVSDKYLLSPMPAPAVTLRFKF